MEPMGVTAAVSVADQRPVPKLNRLSSKFLDKISVERLGKFPSNFLFWNFPVLRAILAGLIAHSKFPDLML
jgi:hypothetical protein